MSFIPVGRSSMVGWLIAGILVLGTDLTSQSLAQKLSKTAKPMVAKAPPVNGLTDADFDKLHKTIKPQPGESLFQQVPWLTSVWEARTRAAAEGKPIFVWSGSGGPPLGIC